MVYEDVTLDITGVPNKIPEPYYRRVPLIRTEPESYEDWKRRRGNTKKLLEVTTMEANKLALDVERVAWERGLRERPPFSQETLDLNKRIVEILKGRHGVHGL